MQMLKSFYLKTVVVWQAFYLRQAIKQAVYKLEQPSDSNEKSLTFGE
jgi:hypothetical protein